MKHTQRIQAYLGTAALLFISNLSFASESSIYCPQNHGFINVGMTESQVISACGQPLSKKNSNQPMTKKVPQTQLIYNNQGAPKAFYGVWALPIGNSNPNGPAFGGNTGGAMLQVNLVNNKVENISLNGGSTNAFSICNGTMIKVGDPANLVYNACGTASLVNHSYINVEVPSQTLPQVWTYQPGPYQPTISLTFVDGKLQSIN